MAQHIPIHHLIQAEDRRSSLTDKLDQRKAVAERRGIQLPHAVEYVKATHEMAAILAFNIDGLPKISVDVTEDESVVFTAVDAQGAHLYFELFWQEEEQEVLFNYVVYKDKERVDGASGEFYQTLQQLFNVVVD